MSAAWEVSSYQRGETTSSFFTIPWETSLTRIFSVMALLAFGMLAATIIIGLSIGGFNKSAAPYKEAARRDYQLRYSSSASDEEREAAKAEVQTALSNLKPVRDRATLHKLFGIAAALVAILVNSITVTYFVGTSRWCKEVVETYQLKADLAQESAKLKRRTFPWALCGMLMIVVIAALGAASDPGANVQSSQTWVTPHYLFAISGVGVVGWSFLMQMKNIRANYKVINRILDQVRSIRTERGLDEAQSE